MAYASKQLEHFRVSAYVDPILKAPKPLRPRFQQRETQTFASRRTAHKAHQQLHVPRPARKKPRAEGHTYM